MQAWQSWSAIDTRVLDPDETCLWAALQQASGGTRAGSIFDIHQIIRQREAGDRRQIQA